MRKYLLLMNIFFCCRYVPKCACVDDSPEAARCVLPRYFCSLQRRSAAHNSTIVFVSFTYYLLLLYCITKRGNIVRDNGIGVPTGPLPESLRCDNLRSSKQLLYNGNFHLIFFSDIVTFLELRQKCDETYFIK